MNTALSPSDDTTSVKLTQVQIELLSMKSIRIQEIECAPNGYFFLPVNKPGKRRDNPFVENVLYREIHCETKRLSRMVIYTQPSRH